MPTFNDITGQKFGKLTVLSRAENDGIHTAWNCLCDCGKEKRIRAQSLKTGMSKSCGCVFNRPPQEDPRFVDLTGQKFNRLTVMGFSHQGDNRKCYWTCLCDCGKETRVVGTDLKSGNSKSCGCYAREVQGKCNITHGMSHKPGPWRRWQNMRHRCNNPADEKFTDYGGRGIKVCDQWNKPHGGFEVFLADMGLPPTPEHTLDRIDVNKGYEPGNVKWSTMKEQNLNKRGTLRIAYNGHVVPLKTACEVLRIDYQQAHARIFRDKEIAQTVVDNMLEIASKEPTQQYEWARRS